MADSLIIITLIIVASIGVFVGLSGVVDFNTGGNGGLFASALAAVQTDFSTTVGEFLISFDDFKNTHQALLNPSTPVKVFDIEVYEDTHRIFAATDQGVFLSRDGGLTWNRINTYANEITDTSLVFALLPTSSNGNEFILSVFSGGVGTVYKTRDSFFTLEKIVDFDDEAVYDMYQVGNRLYMALSNGQLLQWNLSSGESRVLTTFSSPARNLYVPGDGYVYAHLVSGALLRAESFLDDFIRVRVPGGGWFGFGGAWVTRLAWDEHNTLWVVTKKGLYKSVDAVSFDLITSIPMQDSSIDAVASHGGLLYVMTDTRMFISSNSGVTWRMLDFSNNFPVSHIYFIGPRTILSM